FDQVMTMFAATKMRHAGGDHAVGELVTGCNTQTTVIEECPATALSGIKFIAGRIINYPGNHLSLTLKRDRNSENRNTVQKVCGAIKRINDPAVLAVFAFNSAAFFHQEAVIRTGTAQLAIDEIFRFAVGLGDIIAGTL